MWRLRELLDDERRQGMKVLVATRWFLLVAAIFVVDYRPGTTFEGRLALNTMIALGIALNVLLQASLVRRKGIPTALPLAAGVYDVAAILAAVALVDGLENPVFVFLLPALMAFSLAFPGRPSLVYGAAVIVAYVVVISVFHRDRHGFETATYQKAVAVRTASMAATVMAANLVMSVERGRRLRAVAAERERQQEVQALQARAIELERAAEAERQRLLREVHDGISQSLYMLSLGMETAAVQLVDGQPVAPARARIDALATLAKQALLDARGLLFDLRGVLRGETSLSALVRNQAAEFQAVTGIPTTVEVEGQERQLPSATVGEVYRVLQEGLANAFRHAEARSVRLRLHFTPDEVLTEIADDGRGFDLDAPRDRGHGLGTMSERSRELGGTLVIDSRPGQGTSIVLRIPNGAPA